MGSIRRKGTGYSVAIRRKGWPDQYGTFRTMGMAKEWEREIESQMARGVFIDRSAAKGVTLGDLILVYDREVTSNRPGEKSRVAESARLRRFIREEDRLCSYAVANLRPEHFEDYRDRRLSQTVGQTGKFIKPGTVKRELTLLKRVIDHRKRRLGLLVNPANTEDVRRPAVHDERDVRLTPEERSRLMEACDQARNKWLRPIVELGFETGARQGTLLRLRWSDVDLDIGTAILRHVKNSRNPHVKEDHGIGLSPRAIEVLKAVPRNNGDDDRIFPITANALRLAFNRARQKAGVPHFRFHDTRHELTSSLFEAGWSMPEVMAQTGHKDPKSVKRYANIMPQHLAARLAATRPS